MGLFAKIAAVGKTLKSDIAGGLNLLTAAYIQPIKTTQALLTSKEAVQKQVSKFAAAPPLKTSVQTVAAAATYSAALLTGGGIIAGGAKALIPTTIKGAVTLGGAAVTALGVTGLLVGSEKARKEAPAIIEQFSPANLVGFGVDVGKWIDNPSLSELKRIAKENPALLAAIGAAVVIAGGKALMIYNSWKSTQIQKDIRDIMENPPTPPATPPASPPVPPPNAPPIAPEPELPKETIKATDEGKPITAETTTISTSKRRRKRSRMKDLTPMRQSMRVNIVNSYSANRLTKNYLNREVLAIPYGRNR